MAAQTQNNDLEESVLNKSLTPPPLKLREHSKRGGGKYVRSRIWGDGLKNVILFVQPLQSILTTITFTCTEPKH